MHLLETQFEIALPRQRVFEFFANAENLGAITPPELDFRILTPLPIEMRKGTLIDYRIGLWRIPMRWRTRITRWNPPYDFVDEQLEGPYRTWIHTHRFTRTPTGTMVHDRVAYLLPFEPLGRLALPLVRRQLNRIFSYRAGRIAELLGNRS
jgi:ligand-binding SRPBCC domain-containing protein